MLWFNNIFASIGGLWLDFGVSVNSKYDKTNLQEALRVFPAVTRLTVYRRRSVDDLTLEF